jgi:hypothetical protein
MSSPDSAPIYSERKPFVALVSTALAFGIGIVAAVKYGHYWIAVAILVLYLLGVSHTTLSVRVSASDVVVRSLTNTQQYYLHEITDVKISSGVASDLRLVFPQEIVKISGFSNTQVRNLQKAILTAREHATPEV